MADPAAERLCELLRGADFAFTNLEMVPSSGRGHPVRNAAPTAPSARPTSDTSPRSTASPTEAARHR